VIDARQCGRRLAAKPILEVNPCHQLIVALAELNADALAFKDDAVHLLFDEARVLDCEHPADARAFSDRLARGAGARTGDELTEYIRQPQTSRSSCWVFSSCSGLLHSVLAKLRNARAPF
jgi:hypothetical protein